MAVRRKIALDQLVHVRVEPISDSVILDVDFEVLGDESNAE